MNKKFIEEKDNPETEKRGMGETEKKGSSALGLTDAREGTTPHPFEALLDEYPVRDPSEDPVWSVRIIKGWLYFLAFNFAWMFLFMILGFFYE